MGQHFFIPLASDRGRGVDCTDAESGMHRCRKWHARVHDVARVHMTAVAATVHCRQRVLPVLAYLLRFAAPQALERRATSRGRNAMRCAACSASPIALCSFDGHRTSGIGSLPRSRADSWGGA